jgi:glycyl-tRNA synthetase beta subunit
MLTTKRILAHHRVLEKRRVELEKAEEYDRDLMKKAGIDLDQSMNE